MSINDSKRTVRAKAVVTRVCACLAFVGACATAFGADQGIVEDTLTPGTLPGTVLRHNHRYTVENDVTIDARSMPSMSALRVPVGAAVIIKINAGKTLTVLGGPGYGRLSGGAGISVPYGSKLIIDGDGTLNATGGVAAAGCTGFGASAGVWGGYMSYAHFLGDGHLPLPRSQLSVQDIRNGIASTNLFKKGKPLIFGRSGCGGIGGAGGGGAGAGIGGVGGAGGEGGMGGLSPLIVDRTFYADRKEDYDNCSKYMGLDAPIPISEKSKDDFTFCVDGKIGGTGGDGKNGRGCGQIIIIGKVTINAGGGDAARGGLGGSYGASYKMYAVDSDAAAKAWQNIAHYSGRVVTGFGMGMDIFGFWKFWGEHHDPKVTPADWTKTFTFAGNVAGLALKTVGLIVSILGDAGYFDRLRLKTMHWYTGGGGGGGGAGGGAAQSGIGSGGPGGGGGGGGGSGLFEIGAGCVFNTDFMTKPILSQPPLELSGHGGFGGFGAEQATSFGHAGSQVKFVTGIDSKTKKRTVPYNCSEGRIGAWSWLRSTGNWAWGGLSGAGGMCGSTNVAASTIWISTNATVRSDGTAIKYQKVSGESAYTITFHLDGSGTEKDYYLCGTLLGRAPSIGDRSQSETFCGFFTQPDIGGKQYFDRYGNPIPGVQLFDNLELYPQFRTANNANARITAIKDGSSLSAGATLEANTIYHFTKKCTFGPGTGSGLILSPGNTIFYIDRGVTVTAQGADAKGTQGAYPGVEVPTNATLIVVGGGVLEATGGSAAMGVNGENGTSAQYAAEVKEEDTPTYTTTTCHDYKIGLWRVDYYFKSGNGGAGGAGGGGAAPGVGGRGGLGGAGGAACERLAEQEKFTKDNENFRTTVTPGYPGVAGTRGTGMGSVYVFGSSTLEAKAGNGVSSNASGGNSGYHYGACADAVFKQWLYGAGAGAGGGGGGSGGTPTWGIGGGAGGGGGGGAGGNGGLAYEEGSKETTQDALRCHSGTGGGGGAGGAAGDAGCSAFQNVARKAGIGGTGGAYGGNGADGFLAASHDASVNADGRDKELAWSHPALERTINFFYEGRKLGSVAAQLGEQLPVIPEALLHAIPGYTLADAHLVMSSGLTNAWYGVDGQELHDFEGLEDVDLEVELMPKWEAMAMVPGSLYFEYANTNYVAFDAEDYPGCQFVEGTTNATDAGLYSYTVRLRDDCEIWTDFDTNVTRKIEWYVAKAAITNDWKTNTFEYAWNKSLEDNIKDMTASPRETLGFDLPPGTSVSYAFTRSISAGYYALEARIDGGKNYTDRTYYGSYLVQSPIEVNCYSRYPWDTKIDACFERKTANASDLERFERYYGSEQIVASFLIPPKTTTDDYEFVDVQLGTVDSLIFNEQDSIGHATIDLVSSGVARKLGLARTNALEVFIGISSNLFKCCQVAVDLSTEKVTDAGATWPKYNVDRQEDVYPLMFSYMYTTNGVVDYSSNGKVLFSVGQGKPEGKWFEPTGKTGPIKNNTLNWKPTGPGLFVLEHAVVDQWAHTNGYHRAYINYTGPAPTESMVLVTRLSGWTYTYPTLEAAAANLTYGDTVTILGDVQCEIGKIPSGTTVCVGENGVIRTPSELALTNSYLRTVPITIEIKDGDTVRQVNAYRYELNETEVQPLIGDEDNMPALDFQYDDQGRIVGVKILVRNMKSGLYYEVEKSENLDDWIKLSKTQPEIETGKPGYLTGEASGDKGFYRVTVTDDPTPTFTYTEGSDGSVVITGASGDGNSIMVPKTIDGKTVTGIAANAFKGHTALTYVEIAEGVTSIAADAFNGCTCLAEVAVPSTLKTIGERAFANCPALTSFDLPDGFEELGGSAFSNSGLKALYLPASVKRGASPGLVGANQTLYVEPGVKFGDLTLGPNALSDGTTIKYWVRFTVGIGDSGLIISNACAIADGELAIPSEIGGVPVVEIADGAFSNRSDITRVTISDSVKRIGHLAFCDCENLHEITFGTSVNYLGVYVFSAGVTKQSVFLYFTGDAPQVGGDLGLSADSIVIPLGTWSGTENYWQGSRVHRNGQMDCLTFVGTNAFSLAMSSGRTWDGRLYWSNDDETWTEWDGGKITAAANTNGSWRIYLWGTTGNTAICPSGGNSFQITPAQAGEVIECHGNLESLRGGLGNLPSETPMASHCYHGLFAGCTSLATTPDLTATVLSASCYQSLFEGCTALMSLPTIPATTLAERCCKDMFAGCVGLVVSPSGSGTEWRIDANAEATDWNSGMFTNVPGGVPANPARNTTYYVQSRTDEANCLMFVGTSAFSVSMSKGRTWNDKLYWSNGDTAWTEWDGGKIDAAADTNKSWRIYLWGTADNAVICPESGNSFQITNAQAGATVECRGSVEALRGALNNLPSETAMGNACYHSLFADCTALTSAPNLPATTLSASCYNSMFRRCSALKAAPALPATAVGPSSYYCMFHACSALSSVPNLAANTLQTSSCESMFESCRSLGSVPSFAPTTLAEKCCYRMFACSGMWKAPALPATKLEVSCYESMFQSCTSLGMLPVISATTLANRCCASMFQGCSNLCLMKQYYTGYTSVLTAWRINADNDATDWNSNMISGMSKFTDAPESPSRNTTYYYSTHGQMYEIYWWTGKWPGLN